MNRIVYILFTFFLLFVSKAATADIIFADDTSDIIQIIPDTLAPDTNNVNDTLNIIQVPDALLSPSALESLVKYHADDSIVFDIENKRVLLYGNAQMEYLNIQLNAGFISIDFDRNTLYAEGIRDTLGRLVQTPVFSEDGQSFLSTRMAYNFTTRRGVSYDIMYEMNDGQGEGYMHGSVVKKDENDIIYVQHAKYTTCDLPHPHFHIAAGRAKIIPQKQIITGPAYLVVQDVPLPLAIPFGFFPNQQKQASGVIIPTYGEDIGNLGRGFFLRDGGYFVTVNDHLNFSILGDIYSKGDYRLGLSSNYAVRYRFRGMASFSYATRYSGIRGTENFSIGRDFMVNWQHSVDQRALPNSNFSANVRFGNSRFLKNHSLNPDDIINNNLNSSISYSRRLEGTPFNLSSSLSHHQNISTGEITFSAPTVNLGMQTLRPFSPAIPTGAPRWYENISIGYNMNFRNDIRTNDSLLFEENLLNQANFAARHTIPVNTSFNIFRYFDVTPSFNYTNYTFFSRTFRELDLSDTSWIDIRDRGVFFAHDYSLTSQLSTRIYGLFNVNRGGILAIRHVLRPSFGFTYRPDFTHERFGVMREVRDPAGEAIQYSVFEREIFPYNPTAQQGLITFSLNNNLEMKTRARKDTAVTSRKVYILESFDISTNYNILADSLNLANINMSARTTLFNRLNLQFTGGFDPYVIEFDTSRNRMIRRNEFEIDKNNRLARLTSGSLNIGTSLNRQGRQRVDPHFYSPYYSPYYLPYHLRYADFSIPWDLSLGYNLYYSDMLGNINVRQNMQVSGNVNLTEKWKVGFNTDYDFTNNQMGFTSINIHRDLHCWEMSFNWIPIGTYKMYAFSLRVKSPVLSDLKIDRRGDFRTIQ